MSRSFWLWWMNQFPPQKNLSLNINTSHISPITNHLNPSWQMTCFSRHWERKSRVVFISAPNRKRCKTFSNGTQNGYYWTTTGQPSLFQFVFLCLTANEHSPDREDISREITSWTSIYGKWVWWFRKITGNHQTQLRDTVPPRDRGSGWEAATAVAEKRGGSGENYTECPHSLANTILLPHALLVPLEVE